MSKVLTTEKTEIDEKPFTEIRIVKVKKDKSTPEGIKYSFALIREGRRILGYDNHENKGHHKNLYGVIIPYTFTTTNAVRADFRRDVQLLMKDFQ